MKNGTNFIKASVVLALSGFMMGNTQCQQPVADKRELKKNVKVIQMNASSFMDSGGFNFSEVAKSLYSGVLFNTNYFYERNSYPTTQDVNGTQDQNYFHVQNSSGTNTSQKMSAVDSKTMVQLKAWFPEMKAQEVVLNRDSSCFITRPQHFIAGKINSLEAYGGGSLQFGFSQTALPKLPISAHFSLDKMRMDVSFHALDPWTLETVDSENSEAMKTDYKVGFGIDLGGIVHIGPELYRTTGMAEVTLKALQNATKLLGESLTTKRQQEWSSRIMVSRDNYVAILGGKELGLRKGDQLKVFNEVHTWNGEPCGESSVLAGSLVVSDVNEPWIVEIEVAGDLMSRAKVLNIKENETMSVGALVQLHKFAADVAPAAKK